MRWRKAPDAYKPIRWHAAISAVIRTVGARARIRRGYEVLIRPGELHGKEWS